MKWLTEQQVQKLKEVWATASREEIGNLFPGRKYASLAQRARKLGLKSLRHRNSKGDLSPLLSETVEAYYWLGFILADGYLSKQNALSVCLSLKDIIHLQKLARFLRTHIRKVDKQKYKMYSSKTKAVIISVGDSALVPQIKKKLGMKTSNKTYNPPALPEMNRDQTLSFLAGYIDGDGCMAKQGDCKRYKREDVVIQVKCHISWFETLCEMERKIYQELGFHLERPHVRVTKQGYAFWKISNNKVIRTFKVELVNLKLPIMERKWNKVVL